MTFNKEHIYKTWDTTFLKDLLVFRNILIYTKLSNSGQGISHHIIFTFNVPDVQVEFLQGQAPPHQPLIFVFHPTDEGGGGGGCGQ